MIDTKVRYVTPADGNVFADLGFAPEEATNLKSASQALIDSKIQLMDGIGEWIKNSGLKQAEAARILGISRPRVSDVVNHKADKFTLDALVMMLAQTGKAVQMAIK